MISLVLAAAAFLFFCWLILVAIGILINLMEDFPNATLSILTAAAVIGVVILFNL